MKLPRHTHRTATALAALTALLSVSGCSSTADPEPTPTPTALVFETDEEAYAAAEEVYRAYVEVYNTLDYSDPHSFSKVEPFITGDYRQREKEGLSAAYAENRTLSGESEIVAFDGIEYKEQYLVTAAICEDVSSIEILDAHGESTSTANRPNRVSILANFEITDGVVKISAIHGNNDPSCTG